MNILAVCGGSIGCSQLMKLDYRWPRNIDSTRRTFHALLTVSQNSPGWERYCNRWNRNSSHDMAVSKPFGTANNTGEHRASNRNESSQGRDGWNQIRRVMPMCTTTIKSTGSISLFIM